MKDKILVIEDDQDILDVITILLRREGYYTLQASTGAQALEQIDQTPDLIILDNQLPDGCGLDFCKELRRASDIPVIMISAEGGITGETDALKQGVNVYLRKPYAMEELLYHVERLTSTCPAMTL